MATGAWSPSREPKPRPGDYRGREFEVKPGVKKESTVTSGAPLIETNPVLMNLKIAKLDKAINEAVGDDQKAFNAIKNRIDVEGLARVSAKEAQQFINEAVDTAREEYAAATAEAASAREAARAARQSAKKIA